MNRRKLLATSGIAIASIAGCYGLGQTLTAEDSPADTDGTSAGGSSPSGESPTESATQDNASATDAENTSDAKEEAEEEHEQRQEQEQQSDQAPPDEDPRNVIEIEEHEMIFEEADDPHYGSDELYLTVLFRNTADHPLQNVRLDGYAYASDQPVGHEFLEYAAIDAGDEIADELPFFVENPEQVDRYEFEVTAAQWA